MNVDFELPSLIKNVSQRGKAWNSLKENLVYSRKSCVDCLHLKVVEPNTAKCRKKVTNKKFKLTTEDGSTCTYKTWSKANKCKYYE